MANIMGTVRLARGRVGYFDEITRVHLTIQSQDGYVYEGMNTENLKRAVMNGTIHLINGTLDYESIKKEPVNVLKGTEEVKVAEVKTEEVKSEEVLTNEVDAEDVKTDEPTAEETKYKKNKSKKQVER